MKVWRAVSSWKTAAVWAIAALATALAWSTISAAQQRDVLIRGNVVGTERRIEVERLLDATRTQLEESADRAAIASEERDALLEQLVALRCELRRSGVVGPQSSVRPSPACSRLRGPGAPATP